VQIPSMSSLKDLTDALNDFCGLFVEWFFAALHPIKKCQDLLSIEDERVRVGDAMKLWLTAFLVAVVIDIPLYHSHGIEWNSLGFHLVSFLCLTAAMVISGFAIQISLKMYGIKSISSDIIAMYVAYFMSYQPLIAVLSYFHDLRIFALLDSARLQGLDLAHLISFFQAQSKVYNESLTFIGISSSICLWLAFPLSCIGYALMATTISARYSVSRAKSFSAVAFAVGVLIIPIGVAQGFISSYIVYTFMGSSTPR
jgi:hypothetical protein